MVNLLSQSSIRDKVGDRNLFAIFNHGMSFDSPTGRDSVEFSDALVSGDGVAFAKFIFCCGEGMLSEESGKLLVGCFVHA